MTILSFHLAHYEGKGTKLGEGGKSLKNPPPKFGIFAQICGPIQDFYVRDYDIWEYYVREKFMVPLLVGLNFTLDQF
jgi:hypothetical protein